ncbi:MAG: hypothetical protein LBD22_02425, partial [Spirochaetaceae bacterium]|nr:hypothetical protein [Spirochaetaceae bacterium]
MMKFKIFCVLSLFLLGEQGVFSWEIGFLFNNDFRLETMAGASERPRELHESIKVSNWLSFFPTTNTSFYFKVSLNALNTAILSEDSNWNINGELDIARLSIFPAYFFFAELGRIPHTDINKLIANSFFDGTSISITGTRHAVTASALYTGLLSKESAKIMLTKNDLTEYYTSTYFAQPHILLSLSYHYLPSFFNGDSSLEAQAIRHIDMRENSTNATTFALGKASLAFSSNLNLVLGAAFSIAEDGDDTNYSISSLLDLVLNLNRSFPSRLSLELR